MREMAADFVMFVMIMACVYRVLAQSTTSCSTSITFSKTVRQFAACVDLPSQGAKLSWTYSSSNNTLDVAFSGVATSPKGWVGWGINPSVPDMIGSSALVAFQAPNGSTMLDYKLTADTQAGTLPSCSPIDLVILDRDVLIEGRNVVMYALIKLKPNQTKISHVWNRGPGFTSDFKIQQHSIGTNDLQGRGSFDISAGTVSLARPRHQKMKNSHGFLNAVGWGILLPLGVMSARYVRPVHDPTWFYLHVGFQSSGYILGIIGWAFGLKLGSYSQGVVYHHHRNIGIALFVFGTLQVLAGAFRPSPEHKVRPYWNVGHHTLGYLTLILSFVNIFKGLDILEPSKKWRNAYIAILVILAITAFVLEVVTWVMYFKKKRDEKLRHKSASNGHQGEVEM